MLIQSEKTSLERDFFELQAPFKEVDEVAFVTLLNQKPDYCHDLQYTPNKLKNPYPRGRYRVKGVIFRNVSFSHTTIADFEFTNCTFERCLFIGTIFRDCRFTSGRFIDCNPYRIEFQDCFVDPSSFDDCICDAQFSNIGVYLFQELLRNSRQQAQPDFSDEAHYRFMKWKRYRLWQEITHCNLRKEKCQLVTKFLGLLFFDCVSGSGARLGRLLISSILVLLTFALINWSLAAPMGLISEQRPVISFVDAFYFSTVVTTTLGFGDISPTTQLGRMVVSVEAIIGFVLFAFLTSTMYRKLTS